VQNAIIPILVLAAHAWSRSAAPCDARFPDLDIVAGLALVSFGWLALGNATGLNAVTFYGITAMGMVMGLSALP
jgi:phytol kinase